MISRIGMTSGLATLFALATCLFAPYTASANLIFDSSLGGVTGSGLGAVSTILTIQSPGSGTLESGSVERASGADVNADEPGGNSITLTGLQMSVFNGSSDIFDAHLAQSVTFPTTFSGIGKQGFVFRLDAAQAAALQTLLDPLTAATVAGLRLGLSASA